IRPLDPDTRAAMARDRRWGNNAQPDPLGFAELGPAIGAREPRTISWRLGSDEYRTLVTPLQQTRWTYVAALPVATFEAPANTLKWHSILAALFGISLVTL